MKSYLPGWISNLTRTSGWALMSHPKMRQVSFVCHLSDARPHFLAKIHIGKLHWSIKFFMIEATSVCIWVEPLVYARDFHYSHISLHYCSVKCKNDMGNCNLLTCPPSDAIHHNKWEKRWTWMIDLSWNTATELRISPDILKFCQIAKYQDSMVNSWLWIRGIK